MAKVKVRLLKPLNGAAIGSEAELDQPDVERLVSRGAVEVIEGKAAPKAAGKAKAAPAAPKNKMEPAPANKSGQPGTTTD